MASLAFEGVTKVFPDGTEAVSHFDLDVGDGELMVLVGPSGSGKSTALRMLAGLEEATAGTIRIGTRVVNDVAPKDRDIAMVFQSYALYPHMDVGHNLGFALRMQRMQRATIGERVGAAARRLGLSELVDKRPKNLSGGQRQRVAMGRAIVREPQAFLMDEPLSNLDAKLRVQMRAEIARIQQDMAVTTLYVTHDQVEAMTMGDRVAVMRKGELQQMAEPQRLYDTPKNLFVASFIGSPSMNVFEGTMQRTADGLAVEIGDQTLPVPPEAAQRHAALAGYVGRTLAVGIRPEHLEDAAVARNGGARLRGRVLLTEALGSEILAHVEMQAKPVVTDDVIEGAVVDADEHEMAADLMVDSENGDKTTVVGRFDPASRVRPGSDVELVVDTEKLQFFDLETGFAV